MPLTALSLRINRRDRHWPRVALAEATTALCSSGCTAMADELRRNAPGLHPEELWGLLGRYLRLQESCGPTAPPGRVMNERGNAGRTGILSGARLVRNGEDLLCRWQRDRRAEQTKLVAAPLVLDEAALVCEGRAAGKAATLRCLGLKDGEELWAARLGPGMVSSPALSAKGLVVVGTSKGVSALRLEDGQPLWLAPSRSVRHAPLIAGERVLWTDAGGQVLCARLRDGHMLWRASGKTSRGLAAYGQTVVAIGGGGLLRGRRVVQALRLESGERLWQQELNTRRDPYLCLSEGKVVLAHGARLCVLDLKDGSELWGRWLGEDCSEVFAPSIGTGEGGEALVVAGTADGYLQARRLEDGSTAWSKGIMFRSEGWSAPLIAGDRGLIAGQFGFLWAFDVATGEALWERELGSTVSHAPALCGGTLVVGCDDGRTLCLSDN